MSNLLTNLWQACSELKVAPTKPFASVEDFQGYVLEKWPASDKRGQNEQRKAVERAVREAEQGHVAAAVQSIKNIRSAAAGPVATRP